MNLCTLQQVKTRLPIEQEQIDKDAELVDLIGVASDEIEDHLGRFVMCESHVEYFDVRDGDLVFYLHGWPITSVTTINNDYDYGFTSGSLVDSDSYFAVLNDRRRNELHFKYDGILYPGRQVLKVVYVGGMAVSTGAFVTAYKRVADLAVWRTCQLFRSGKHIGASNVGSQVGSVTWSGDEEWRKKLADIDSERFMIV